jgi:hypothetical protein
MFLSFDFILYISHVLPSKTVVECGRGGVVGNRTSPTTIAVLNSPVQVLNKLSFVIVIASTKNQIQNECNKNSQRTKYGINYFSILYI